MNILNGKKDIDFDIAMKLGKIFGMTTADWLKIQTVYYKDKNLLDLKNK